MRDIPSELRQLIQDAETAVVYGGATTAHRLLLEIRNGTTLVDAAERIASLEARISGALAICEEWINDDAGKLGSPETIVAIHDALEGTQQ